MGEESTIPTLIQGSGSSHLVLVLGDPVVVEGGVTKEAGSPDTSGKVLPEALCALMVQDWYQVFLRCVFCLTEASCVSGCL